MPIERVDRLDEALGQASGARAASDDLGPKGAFVLRSHVLDRVSEALARAGRQALLVKGAALALTVYETPWSRPMDDIDLLVRREDLGPATRALEAAGLVRLEAPGRWLSASYLDETMLQARLGPRSLLVELHLGLDKVAPRAVDYAAIRGRATTAPGLPGLLLPEREDHVLLVALHAGGHEFRHAKAWPDLHRLLSAGVDLASLEQRARAFGLSTTLYVALVTLRAGGGFAAPDDLLERLSPGPLRRAALATRYDVGAFPVARGDLRLGLAWAVRQSLLRDDLLAFGVGLARYSVLRATEQALGRERRR